MMKIEEGVRRKRHKQRRLIFPRVCSAHRWISGLLQCLPHSEILEQDVHTAPADNRNAHSTAPADENWGRESRARRLPPHHR